ncbi:unnamed protein product, partial [Iphiclides podalirius]
MEERVPPRRNSRKSNARAPHAPRKRPRTAPRHAAPPTDALFIHRPTLPRAIVSNGEENAEPPSTRDAHVANTPGLVLANSSEVPLLVGDADAAMP